MYISCTLHVAGDILLIGNAKECHWGIG